MTASGATPVLPARTWPAITHAGQDRWHTLCEVCAAEVSGRSVGGTVSAHVVHVWSEHNRT